MGNNGSKVPLHPTRIDIPAETRIKVIELLNEALAYSLDLKTQAKQAHWNVKGLDFYQLHELFDELAGELEEYIDLIAERVTALGGVAMGTVRVAATASGLPEYPFDILDGKDHITALADRYAPYAKLIRTGIEQTDDLGDADTADLFTEISRGVDMRLWFLEAHLQAGSGLVVDASSNGVATSAKTSTQTRAAKSTRATKTVSAQPSTAKKTKTKPKQ
jgi:starvation-inducible DNA-binding protein